MEKEKKPRPYSFIQAFQQWKKENNHSGLCPKKGTTQYEEIMEIYKKQKSKTGSQDKESQEKEE